jgi:hypothetical protein
MNGAKVSRWRWVIILGVVLIVGGAVTTVVYFFKPWRTCPDDESPTACPMLPLDSDIMLAAVLITLLGIILLAVGITFRRPLAPPAEAGSSD